MPNALNTPERSVHDCRKRQRIIKMTSMKTYHEIQINPISVTKTVTIFYLDEDWTICIGTTYLFH